MPSGRLLLTVGIGLERYFHHTVAPILLAPALKRNRVFPVTTTTLSGYPDLDGARAYFLFDIRLIRSLYRSLFAQPLVWK